jgi:hypothetical protein
VCATLDLILYNNSNNSGFLVDRVLVCTIRTDIICHKIKNRVFRNEISPNNIADHEDLVVCDAVASDS